MIKNRSGDRLLKNRYKKELVFRFLSLSAVVIAVFMLAVIISSIVYKGYTAFYNHAVVLEVDLNEDILFDDFNEGDINYAYIDEAIMLSFKNKILQAGLSQEDLEFIFYDDFFSKYSLYEIQYDLKNKKELLNTTKEYRILASSNVDMYLKGYLSKGSIINDSQAQIIDLMINNNMIKKQFNFIFFQNSDSRSAEQAGIKGAFLGSLYTVCLVMIFSLIISVGAAIYLEEFAKKGRLSDFIEVNINNLAAVPSIIFGLLGLIVFEQFFGVPRSTSLLASFVLTLMTLPTVVITSRIALSAVPKSIREGALALGSSRLQMILYHLLPISFPGILTGMIISVARVIGETAPLLMIGMVAYLSSAPEGILSKATVFPVQILLWSDSPEIGFVEKASAASMMLLIFLILINWISVYLRKKLTIKL